MNDDRCSVRIIHAQAVEAARERALSADELEELAQVFKILAYPTRLRILNALEHEEMCVCDLAAVLDVSESAVSHQLRFLRGANLVRNRREGTVLYYRLIDDHVKMLVEIGLAHIRDRYE